ncbi:hypothetical protein [Desulfacinum hydrothermale]|nr:hypothetical protein [Desulfacinum hydrothermale]
MTTGQDVKVFLCAPDSERSCFGCCPPIRPAHYDPLDWVGSLKREFRDNRRAFRQPSPPGRPIVGFSCWALGYLDAQGRRIGCLLHPCQNGGRDLRDRVGYGSKCAREQCLASRVFSSLKAGEQRFWLELAHGLNAFYYSSRRANPLFHVLLWGKRVLGAFSSLAASRGWSATELVWRYPFLVDPKRAPRAWRYLAQMLLESAPAPPPNEGLEGALNHLAQGAEAFFRERFPGQGGAEAVFVHQAGLGQSLADFVRLHLGCHRAPLPFLRDLQDHVRWRAQRLRGAASPGSGRWMARQGSHGTDG